MTNPRSFLISNRGRRTSFHFELSDLEHYSWNLLKTTHHAGSGLPPLRSASKIEALHKGGIPDPLRFRNLSDIAKYRSKHHKPKWKLVQDDVRTLPELKSIWFFIIEKFLEFDEKKVGNALKTASQGALWSSP